MEWLSEMLTYPSKRGNARDERKAGNEFPGMVELGKWWTASKMVVNNLRNCFKFKRFANSAVYQFINSWDWRIWQRWIIPKHHRRCPTFDWDAKRRRPRYYKTDRSWQLYSTKNIRNRPKKKAGKYGLKFVERSATTYKPANFLLRPDLLSSWDSQFITFGIIAIIERLVNY